SERDRIATQTLRFNSSFLGYNRLFIYGATCNDSVRDDPQVVELLSPAACGSTLDGIRSPWCRTHQLMGLRLIQRNHCEPDEQIARTVASVQNAVRREQKWDFRLEDAYIQRVMMLVESGRRQEVKAVWLQRIVAAQGQDGGWSGQETIVELTGNRELSWKAHLYPVMGERRPSNLHATAQALYLLALWRADKLLSLGFLTEARVGSALGSQ